MIREDKNCSNEFVPELASPTSENKILIRSDFLFFYKKGPIRMENSSIGFFTYMSKKSLLDCCVSNSDLTLNNMLTNDRSIKDPSMINNPHEAGMPSKNLKNV